MTGYSPFLAVLTGIFEFGAAVWTLTGTGRKRILLPVAALLLLLAGYQFAEVAVCSDPARLLWARWAYFDISWLPPLGIWLAAILGFSGRRGMKVIALAYFAAAAAFCLWIFADPSCITKSVCQVVTARYISSDPFEWAYAVFYQSGLAVMVFGATAGLARTTDAVLRKHLADLQAGTLGFILPALAIRILSSEPKGLLPSVMCHFALVQAVFLCGIVLRERRPAASK